MTLCHKCDKHGDACSCVQLTCEECRCLARSQILREQRTDAKYVIKRGLISNTGFYTTLRNVWCTLIRNQSNNYKKKNNAQINTQNLS
jgi:hypothetical protein